MRYCNNVFPRPTKMAVKKIYITFSLIIENSRLTSFLHKIAWGLLKWPSYSFWIIKKKESALCDTRLPKGRDLTPKCSLGGILKDHFVGKNWSVWRKKTWWGVNFFKGLGLSMAPKPEFSITQLSSRIAFFHCLDLLEFIAPPRQYP